MITKKSLSFILMSKRSGNLFVLTNNGSFWGKRFHLWENVGKSFLFVGPCPIINTNIKFCQVKIATKSKKLSSCFYSPSKYFVKSQTQYHNYAFCRNG